MVLTSNPCALEHCQIALSNSGGCWPHILCRILSSGLDIFAFISPLVLLEWLPGRSHSEHISLRGWFPAEVLSLMLGKEGWIPAPALLTRSKQIRLFSGVNQLLLSQFRILIKTLTTYMPCGNLPRYPFINSKKTLTLCPLGTPLQ